MDLRIKYILIESRKYRKNLPTDQKTLSKISKKDIMAIYCANYISKEEKEICQKRVFLWQNDIGEYKIYTYPHQECDLLCEYHKVVTEHDNPMNGENFFIPVRNSDIDDFLLTKFKKPKQYCNTLKTLPYFIWLFNGTQGKYSWADKITSHPEKYSDIECINNRIIKTNEEKLVNSIKKGSFIRIKSYNTIVDMEFVDRYVYIPLKYKNETILLRHTAQNVGLFKRYYAHTIYKLEEETDYELYIYFAINDVKEIGNVATISCSLIFGISFNLNILKENQMYHLREPRNELTFVKCANFDKIKFKIDNDKNDK